MNKPFTAWPELKFEQLKDTIATVQLWTQIVGKIRLSSTPWTNHSWHVTLYVSAKGLTTGSIPYQGGIFQIDFDFVHHQLIITSNWSETVIFNLYPRSVADFYQELMDKLNALGIHVKIYSKPNELEQAIPFSEDEIHSTYDKNQIHQFWQALIKVSSAFTTFRTGFVGKCSPVHLFWGAFDLAVTRFSGRKAPQHSGGAPNIPLKVMQEAYSHEVSSCGFWPGSESFPEPAFYAYCYPTPPDFGQQKVEPKESFYSDDMGEFFLTYETVRLSENPEATLLHFLNSTYLAAANTGHWDRNTLECDLSSFNHPLT
jgi:hypothetical protein